MMYSLPFGAIPTPQVVRPAILSCPTCSYLVDSSCVVCPDGDPHPGCEGCVAGRIPPPPWYKHDLFVSIAGAVVFTVVGTMVLNHLERKKLL